VGYVADEISFNLESASEHGRDVDRRSLHFANVLHESAVVVELELALAYPFRFTGTRIYQAEG
jgi:hypothetical protein